MTQLNLPIIIVGDFNYDLLSSNSKSNELRDAFHRQSMEQIIEQPTRITKNTSTLIDHIWVSDKEHISDLQILPGMSDHQLCTFKIEIEYRQKGRQVFKYRQINKNADKIVEELARYNWEDLQSINEVETIWNTLKTRITDAIDKYAPIKRSHGNDRNQPWMTEELKQLSRKKQAMQLSGDTAKNQSDWKEMKKLVKRETFIQKKNFYSKRVEDNKNNPDKLWKIIKEIAPSNFGNRKEETKMDKEMLDRLNTHFAETGNRIQHQIEEENKNSKMDIENKVDTNRRPVSRLENIKNTTEDEIKKIVKKLNSNKATGIDEIPVKVIKLGIDILAKPLTILINKILNVGKFPQDFKTALVTPAHKKGDKNKLDNYRPLSVLPVISKLAEYIIKDQLYDYLEVNNIIAKEQHAFRNYHSTTTCLLKLTEDVRNGLDNGMATGVLAIDLSKAFDAINHSILIAKLRDIGINGHLLDLICDYLSNRTQFVKYEEMISNKQSLTHGVPQGSILGPLLFTIYINDLKETIKTCNILSYADDTTVYYASKHASNIQVAINNDIKNMEKWFVKNKMKLNEMKTEFMVIHPQNTTRKFEKIHIKMKGRVIDISDTLKILGITMTNNLKWDKHVNGIIRTCKYHLRAFRRAAKYINIDEKKILYNSCLASRLAYGDVVWKETTLTQKKRLQVIQNQAARAILTKKPRDSAKPLLKELGWMNLEDKRNLHGQVMLHKIKNGKAPKSLQEMLQRYERPQENDTRQGRSSYFIPTYRTNSMASSFYISTIKQWNKVPPEIRETKETLNFKSKLNAYYLTPP